MFVAEFGPVSSLDLVPATVATALGLTLSAGPVSREGIAAAVGTNRRGVSPASIVRTGDLA